MAYLGERPTPLTVTIARDAAPTPAPAPARPAVRRVSFGAVPDFAFQGPGVKLVAT